MVLLALVVHVRVVVVDVVDAEGDFFALATSRYIRKGPGLRQVGKDSAMANRVAGMTCADAPAWMRPENQIAEPDCGSNYPC